MPKSKSVRRIWDRTKSGLILPAGVVSDLSASSSKTYLQIKEKALALERLYADTELALPATCSLAQLIADTKLLSDLSLTNPAELTMTLLFHACHLDRIAEAVLPLRFVADRKKYLDLLTDGSVDLLDRQTSKAKSILWELELWSLLLRHGFDAKLAEPPDIVISFEHSAVGIACKKLYSEKHVQNVLSEGVAQIESSFEFGIVAINLDDLLPSNRVLPTDTEETMGESLSDFNDQFIRTHKRHFRKYLAAGRVISALFSTNILADIKHGRTRFNNARQMSIWTIPGLPVQKEKQMKRFYDQFMG